MNRDDRVQFPIDRVQHLLRILRWFGSEVDDPAVPVPDPLYFRNELAQNYPNPFNPATTIRYSIKEKGRVTLKIYDVAARLVKTLVDEVQVPIPEGFKLEWNGESNAGSPVASGVYFYRLAMAKFELTKKMVLVR